MSKFFYSPMFPLTEDTTEYTKISKSYVKTKIINNSELLIVNPKALTLLSQRAFFDVSHLLRKSHLQQLKNILDDREASQNDRFVALSMLKNANIASSGILPMCQDTGTAIIIGYKGEKVFTNSDDGKYLSLGIYNTYQEKFEIFSISLCINVRRKKYYE